MAKSTAKKSKVNVQVGTTFGQDALARSIIAKTADANGKGKYSMAEANEIIGAFKESIADALKTGQKFQLTGFLTITPSYRKERDGNNVLTGEKIKIPATVSFNAKVGASLKNIAKELPKEVVTAIKDAK